MRDRSAFDATREAREATAHHTGSTAERYQRALDRYSTAIGRPEPTTFPHPPERPWHVAHLQVRDVMTHPPFAVERDASIKRIIAMIAAQGLGAVPVVDSEQHVIGVVSEADLLVRLACLGDSGAQFAGSHHEREWAHRRDAGRTAEQVMTCPAITVRQDASLPDAARVAVGQRVPVLPVVDGSGVLVGVVDRTDLLRVYLTADDDLARHLRDHVLLRHPEISAHVAHGVVDLSGTVDHHSTAVHVVETITGLAGVVAVDDRITYRFDDLNPLVRMTHRPHS